MEWNQFGIPALRQLLFMLLIAFYIYIYMLYEIVEIILDKLRPVTCMNIKGN